MYRRRRACTRSIIVFFVLFCLSATFSASQGAGDWPPLADLDFVSVTTPRQLQEALRSGVQHVVVNDHIDISELPSLYSNEGPGAHVLAIQQNGRGQYTKSIRGNCTGVPSDLSATLQLKPHPQPRQCVISVWRDFLEIAVADSTVWLSTIYIHKLSTGVHTEASLITAGNRELYMTNMTLTGHGNAVRALHVKERSNIFVSGSHISNFWRPWATALLLEAGSRATVYDTTFSHVHAQRGPIAGLLSTRGYIDRIGAAAWFQDCHFYAISDWAIVIEDTRCHAYTSPGRLGVWEDGCEHGQYGYCGFESHKLVQLAHGHDTRQDDKKQNSGDVRDREGVFAHIAAAAQPLPRPSDVMLRQIVPEAAARSGLPAPHLPHLPPGTQLAVVNRGQDKTRELLLAFMPILTCIGFIFCICICVCCWQTMGPATVATASAGLAAARKSSGRVWAAAGDGCGKARAVLASGRDKGKALLEAMQRRRATDEVALQPRAEPRSHVATPPMLMPSV
eukprot:jgi/Ulvmu1/4227/UM019_0206.1